MLPSEKINRTSASIGILSLLLLPSPLFAITAVDYIDSVYGIVSGVLIPIAFAVCMLYFVWGLAKYIRAGAGGENAAKEGKSVMIWGTVGIFVAFCIWGIVAFLKSEVALPEGSMPAEIQKK